MPEPKRDIVIYFLITGQRILQNTSRTDQHDFFHAVSSNDLAELHLLMTQKLEIDPQQFWDGTNFCYWANARHKNYLMNKAATPVHKFPGSWKTTLMRQAQQKPQLLDPDWIYRLYSDGQDQINSRHSSPNRLHQIIH